MAAQTPRISKFPSLEIIAFRWFLPPAINCAELKPTPTFCFAKATSGRNHDIIEFLGHGFSANHSADV